MRKLIRAILFIITLVVVLAVAGVVVAILFTDKAVKTVVEKAGTKTLSVPVRVGKATASLLSGDVRLQDITVANPPGYEGAALVKLQRVDIQANVESVLGKQILIKDMKLQNMEVFVEQKGLQNNLYQVIKPLQERREPTGRGLVIDNLEITDVTVHAGLVALPGQPQSVELKLASIRMVDLGRNEKVDTAVLISKIVLAVAAGIAEQGGGILPKETIGDLGSILDKAIDIGKIIFGPGKTTDGQQKDSLGKSAIDGIKDLFGGKKEQ
jgi:uncharacterized protein involved in outer membrane biogenesis